MQKTASKHIIPSESYEFLRIWVAIELLYTHANFKFNAQYLIEYKRYIHLDTIHARILKFGMYLSCMMLHKFYVVILKIL